MAELVSSFYEASVERPPPHPPLQGDARADVCVIGAGYTGLSCALELAASGRSVIVLEAARTGWGASGRNGGQVIRGYNSEDVSKQAAQAGVEEKYFFDMSINAVNLVRERIRRHSIDCDWRDGQLLAAVHPRHCRELEEIAEKLDRKFNYPTRLLNLWETREAISSRRYCGALADERSGHLHPLKYLLGLARAAADAGAIIHENTRAISATAQGGGARVRTASGEIRCDSLVLAGNAYLDIDLDVAPPPLRPRVMPVGTYIGATAPLGEEAAENLVAGRRAVCDMNFVLDYFRCSACARLLFGGRVSYSNREPRDLRRVMRRRMLAVFPQLDGESLEYAWGGSVAITANRFPDIGRRGQSTYYAQGYSGHGVAMSGFAGKVLASAILGDSEILDVFARVPHVAFPGGRRLRTPLLVLGMLYYRMRDLLG